VVTNSDLEALEGRPREAISCRANRLHLGRRGGGSHGGRSVHLPRREVLNADHRDSRLFRTLGSHGGRSVHLPRREVLMFWVVLIACGLLFWVACGGGEN
jgi:hypothetical protein